MRGKYPELQHYLCTDCSSLSIDYTLRCRCLRDLRYRGPQAQVGVGSVETEPRCVTDLYHGAMGYMALTMHPRPSNYSVGHKRLKRIPSNSSNHSSREVLSIESDAGYRWPLADSISQCPVLTSSLTFRTMVLLSLCRTVWPHSCCVDFNSNSQLLFQLRSWHSIVPPTTNSVRPAH